MFPVSGAVKLSAIPDVPAREVDIVLSVHGAERRRAAVKPDGSFVINEVPTGSHLMEVVAVGYVFPAYRLDVDEDGRKTMAYADDPSIKIDIPFVLEPLMKANYDQVCATFQNGRARVLMWISVAGRAILAGDDSEEPDVPAHCRQPGDDAGAAQNDREHGPK